MRIELQNYIEKTDRELRRKQYINPKRIETHLHTISFYQHERLVHLLVTLFVGICLLISLGFLLLVPSVMIFLLHFALFVLFSCYLLYYYYLDNAVQTLYRQYYKMQGQKKMPVKRILKKYT